MLKEKEIINYIITRLANLGYFYQDEDNNLLKERELSEYIDEEIFVESLLRFNDVSEPIIKEALTKIKNLNTLSLLKRNEEFHELLMSGILIKTNKNEKRVRIVNFDNPFKNSFEIIKDFKVNNTIFDIVIFVNGFPFIIVEVKDKLKDAYNEISSYQNDIPNFFSYNAFSLLTDGKNALIGTVMASFASYKEWRMDLDLNPLEVLLTEFFKKERLMDYIKNSIFFKEKEAEKPVKLVGESYQYFGVLRVLDLINKYRIIENIKHKMRDGKVGLVLEKEGSKALFMAMLAKRLIGNEIFNKPSIVVLTKDDELYKSFYNLRSYLQVKSVKSSIVKEDGLFFMETFSDLTINERCNIIVMVDEDSVKGNLNKDKLPNATYIGFTIRLDENLEKELTDKYGRIIKCF
ncbi:MAG: type I restriction endonuclease [Acholeplasmataceae bacterium]